MIPRSPLPSFDASRFWAAVDRCGGPRNCWSWVGAKNPKGYGRFKAAGRLYLAHRVAYILEKGHFLEDASYHGTVVRHTCDNPSCCNPLHLRLGTQKDNVADMDAKGRGNRVGPNALPQATVSAIVADPRSSRTVAAIYGVSDGHVRWLRRRALNAGVGG